MLLSVQTESGGLGEVRAARDGWTPWSTLGEGVESSERFSRSAAVTSNGATTTSVEREEEDIVWRVEEG